MTEIQQKEPGVESQTESFLAAVRNQTLIQSREFEERLGQEEAENNYADQLNTLRFLEGTSQSIQTIKNTGESFGKPSKFKYVVCGFIAVAKDGMEILALAGVVTIPLAWFIGPIISILLILIFWLFNMQQDRAKEFISGLEKDIEVIQENIAHAIRIANRIPGAKRLAKKGVAMLAARASRSRTLVRLSQKTAGSPLVKQFIAAGIDNAANITVIFQWLPGTTIGVILSYLDERKALRNAAESGNEAYSQLSSQLAQSSQEVAAA